jgi:gliding motility-associated-like protein
MKTLSSILFLLLFFVSVNAQTCAGSLGDPILDYTFGSGAANPGPALPPGVTNLQYATTTCPSDGSYTIANHTDNCFNSGWITMNDHTGDQNGYFMLINASIQPNTFYIDTISNLCGEVTYEFGAWVINVVAVTGNYIEPDLTFTIRSPTGTVLQSNTTGNIPMSGTQWNYYSFNFTASPGTSSVILSITNNAPGGSGNDLAIDDISLRAVGPGIDVGIQGYATDTVSFCGAIPSLTFTSQVDACYPATAYQWQGSIDNGSTWTDIANANSPGYSPSLSAPGAYLYRMAVANTGNINNVQCRVFSSVIAVYCSPAPSIKVSPEDTTVCPGSMVVFTASGGTAYQWSGLNQGPQNTVTVTTSSFYIVSATTGPGCVSVDTVYAHVYLLIPPVITQQATGSCARDTVFLSATGGMGYVWSSGQTSPAVSIHPVTNATYTVSATDANGCTATAAVATVVDQNGCESIDSTFTIPDVYIPNTFTPNVDGANDFFQIFAPGPVRDYIPVFSIRIFNRWGELVYESSDPAFKWDGVYKGTHLPPGVYVYLADYLLKGATIAQQNKGSLTLVR